MNWVTRAILSKCSQQAPARPDDGALRALLHPLPPAPSPQEAQKLPGTLALEGPRLEGSQEGRLHTRPRRETRARSLSASATNWEGVIGASGIWERFSPCPEANSSPGEFAPDERCLTGGLKD